MRTTIGLPAHDDPRGAPRAGEAEFLAVFEQSAVGMVQVSAKTGRFVRVNAKYCELTGYVAEELAGMTPAELTHADDRDADAKAFGSLLRAEVPFYDVEKRYVRKDGGIIRARENATLLRDADGRAVGSMAVIQDITARKQAEEMLHTTETRYRRLFEAAKDGILILDGQTGRITDANPYILEALGLTRAETLGRELWEIGVFADATASRAAMTELQERGYVRYGDLPLESKAGERREVEVVANVYQEGGHRVIQCNIRDITERKRAEQELRLLNRAIAASDAGVFLVDPYLPDFPVVFASEGFERMTGYTAAEALGRNCRFLQGSKTDAAAVDRLREAVHAHRPIRLTLLNYRKDGTPFWSDVAVSPVTGPEGRVTHLVGIQNDVSAQYELQASLQASMDRLALGVKVAGFAIAEVDYATGLNHLTAGAARAFGLGETSMEVTRATVHATFHPDDREELSRRIADSLDPAGPGLFAMDHRVVWPGGEVRWLTVRKQVFFTDDGPSRRPHRGVLAVLDVTDRKQAEARLQQLAADLSEAGRRKDEFLATLAHELRNPLAPIRTGLEVMRMSPAGDPAVVKAREMMERQLGHMVRLVDDLMDASRINSGKVELKREKLLIRTVVDHAVEASRSLIEAGGHALTITVADEPAWVDGDLTRLAQVVSNLLNNAAKYTPNGGRITLLARVEGDKVVIEVADTGTGISADMLPEVFDMFAQVDRTLGRAQGGLGIGLSLVKTILEMHGGTITATSPGLGLGSNFAARLPLAAPDRLPEPATASANETPAPRPAGRRVLVVDDNVDGAESLAMLLGLSGHEARAVHDGPAALAAALDVAPEIVFLDIGLPGMSGYDVAKRFRADATLAGAVLVALTGWGSEDDRRKSKEAGFDHHLTKPVNFEQVQALLCGL